MSGGPFRNMSRTDEQRATAQPSRQSSADEEPQPHVSRKVAASRETSKGERRFMFRPIGIIALVLAVFAAGWLVFSGAKDVLVTGIDGGKYQAVFLSNSQVYFGKLSALNSGYFKLTDVYYLQEQSTGAGSSSNPQSSSDQSNVQLIKLGKEIHSPLDEMIIARDQVLFYENLKTDGKVSKAIDDYRKQNKQ